ncbi:hypothetical protein FAIPA1_230092 [Frankia sp. AiPs1]
MASAPGFRMTPWQGTITIPGSIENHTGSTEVDTPPTASGKRSGLLLVRRDATVKPSTVPARNAQRGSPVWGWRIPEKPLCVERDEGEGRELAPAPQPGQAKASQGTRWLVLTAGADGLTGWRIDGKWGHCCPESPRRGRRWDVMANPTKSVDKAPPSGYVRYGVGFTLRIAGQVRPRIGLVGVPAAPTAAGQRGSGRRPRSRE